METDVSAINGWAAFASQTGNGPVNTYRFKTPEFNSVIEHVKSRIANGTLDATEETKFFNQVVDVRGYAYFTSACMEDWKRKYGDIDEIQIRDSATEDTDRVIQAAHNPEDRDHDQNRLFLSQFDENPQKLRRFFYQKRSEEAGRDLRPWRNIAQEEVILRWGVITSNKQEIVRQLFKSLMQSKWAAVGYIADEEYKSTFMKSCA